MPKVPLPPAEAMKLDSLAEVARGGMGSVELARVVDGRLAGHVLAVKRLHPNIAEDPDFVSMFLDEAWMTAALRHPNVAQVVAWGNDDKGMFLAIELVQGVSLSRLLKEAQLNQEAFAERTVAFICSQICGALATAHTLTAPDGTPLQLVHRDLTPANVLVSFDGLVKIIDFGIAKAEERISHTRTGQLKGKPAYMAPEQQRGAAIDARADIFSFGVVMYELLAGRRPWTAKGAFDVMMEISNDPHPDLGELRKGLNPEFVAIAHKCLQKKPEDRFATVAEIKARLDAWLRAKGFHSDDQQSLANFVLRNSQPQIVWWQEALRGEHAKKKAPTFKELEEKIDEERERAAKAARKAAKQPPPRPAGGLGTVPMKAYPDGPPESVTVPNPVPRPIPGASSRTVAMPDAPSSRDPARASDLGARMGGGAAQLSPASMRNAAPPGASSGAPPPSSRRLMTGAGTEFIAFSPAPPPDVAPQQPLASTVPMAPGLAVQTPLQAGRITYGSALSSAAAAAQAAPQQPHAPQPPHALLQPVAPMAQGVPPSGPAQGVPASGPQPSSGPGVPGAPTSSGGSRAPLMIVLFVLVLAGAAGGAWLAADHFGIGVSAPARTR